MLARGQLGNPWLFEQVLGDRADEPTRDEVLDELEWTIDRCEEHLGADRASRYLRKFYPWYADTMGLTKRERNPLVTAPTTDDARRAILTLARLTDPSGPVVDS
jgi:tRNA-dihydrouridine synthase